jgi:hypothetical protein
MDEGTEPSDRRRPIPSHYIGRHGFGLSFWWGCEVPEVATCLSVDRLGPWWTESFIENPTFTRASLSDVREIMVIMGVPVGELLC